MSTIISAPVDVVNQRAIGTDERLRRLRIKRLRTRPYTPRTNGKAERFIQTLLREWAYAMSTPVPSTDDPSCSLG